MGADSAGIVCSTLDKRIRDDSKLFMIQDNGMKMALGFAGSFRMGQLLRYSLKIPTKPETISTYEYMCTYFIESVRACLNIGGYTRIENNTETGGQFLVGYDGVIYTVDYDFQVGICNPNFDAIGSGSDIAMGSMFSTVKMNPEKRIKLALSAASFFNGGCSPPFTIIVL